MTVLGERFRPSTSVKNWASGSLPDTPPPVTAWYASYWASDPAFYAGKVGGAQVASWNDYSGNGRAVAQATSGFQPLFRGSVAGLNGKRAVEFDRVDDYLQLVAFGPLSQPTEMVVVGRLTNTTAVVTTIPIFDSAAAGNRQALSTPGGASVYTLFAGSTGNTIWVPDTLGHYFHAVFNNTLSYCGMDAIANLFAGGNFTAGTQTLDGLTIGNRYDGSRPSGLQLAFLGVMNRALTLAERTSMHAWSRALYATP